RRAVFLANRSRSMVRLFPVAAAGASLPGRARRIPNPERAATSRSPPPKKEDLQAGSPSPHGSAIPQTNSQQSQWRNQTSPCGIFTDACADECQLALILIKADRVRPFMRVGHRAFQLDLQTLPRRVQPALDRAQRHVEHLGDLDQRMTADVERVER